MKKVKVQIEGQMSIYDFCSTIESFDSRFKVGSQFQTESGSTVLEITDLMPGQIMAQVKNVTLEAKNKYVGARYYMNKESLGKWYFRKEVI